MKENNFEALLKKACEEYAKSSAAEFSSLDTTGFEITAAEREKFNKILQMYSNS